MLILLAVIVLLTVTSLIFAVLGDAKKYRTVRTAARVAHLIVPLIHLFIAPISLYFAPVILILVAVNFWIDFSFKEGVVNG